MFKLIKFLFFVVIVAVLGVMFLPLGSVEFKDPAMSATLSVPSFSMFEGETGAYIANFQSIRSQWALEQEFEKIMKEKYASHVCPDGRTVYFDQKNYITIYDYAVEQGFPFSRFSVEYGRGNSCR